MEKNIAAIKKSGGIKPSVLRNYLSTHQLPGHVIDKNWDELQESPHYLIVLSRVKDLSNHYLLIEIDHLNKYFYVWDPLGSILFQTLHAESVLQSAKNQLPDYYGEILIMNGIQAETREIDGGNMGYCGIWCLVAIEYLSTGKNISEIQESDLQNILSIIDI